MADEKKHKERKSFLIPNFPVDLRLKFKARCALRNITVQKQMILIVERWMANEELKESTSE